MYKLQTAQTPANASVPSQYYILDMDTNMGTWVSAAFFKKCVQDGLVQASSIWPEVYGYLGINKPEPKQIEICVSVVDNDTGQPIYQAGVTGPTKSQITNNLGLAFDKVIAGTYSVSVSMSGYKDFSGGFSVTDSVSYYTYVARMNKNIGPITTTKTGHKRMEIQLQDISPLAIVAISPFNPAFALQVKGAEYVVQNIPAIKKAVQQKLPNGWEISYIDYNYPNLVLEFKETGSDPFTLVVAAVIVLAIAAVLITAFIMIKQYKLIDLESNTLQAQQNGDKTSLYDDVYKKLTDAGVPASDAADKAKSIIDQIYGAATTGTDSLDQIKQIMIYVLIGMAAIAILPKLVDMADRR